MLLPSRAVSGTIASGSVAWAHLASGAVRSGHIGNLAVTSGNYALGSVASGHLASGLITNIISNVLISGTVGSGHLASGSVQGYFGTTPNIVWGTVGVNDFGSGAVVAGKVGSGAITSGTIASGNIGTQHIADGGVTSGDIASGAVGWPHLSTSAVRSGHIATFGTPDGTKFLRDDFSWATAGAGLASGNVGSGYLAVGSVQGYFGTTPHVASGTLGVFDFGSGAIIAGAMGSGSVRQENLASGQIITSKIANGGVASGNIASGNVGWPHIAASAVRSGHLSTTGTPDGTKFLRDDFSWATAGAGLASGNVGSGYLASGSVQGYFGTTPNIASGTVGIFDFGSGAVVVGVIGSGAVISGNIASGQIGTGHLANNAVTSGDIASGQVAWAHLSLEAARSGHIGSGAVEGYFGNNRHIVSGTVGVFDLGSGAVVAGRVGSGAVVSGNIASGQISTFHIADGGITSGDISSGNVAWAHLASGAVRSGHLSTTGSPDGTKFLRDDFVWSPASISSGAIGSGYVASGAVQGYYGSTPHIASGTLGVFDFGSGAVIAGAVGSGAIRSGNIASGVIGTFHIADGGVTSGDVGSGQIGRFHLASGVVGSGAVASGSLSTYHFASGATVTRAQFTGPFFSGTSWSILTEERISGVRGVHIASGGTLRIAMASVSGRYPAMGVVVDNTESGIAANVYNAGVFQTIAGLADYSGYTGKQLFLGRSGQVVTVSGSFNSGGLLSGDIWQALGVVLNSGGFVLGFENTLPTVVSLVYSGDIASGNVAAPHLASGAVGSGHVASGSVIGSIPGGGSAHMIASGSIMQYNFGSGVVNSGHLASGAVIGQAGYGTFTIASGTISTFDLASGAAATRSHYGAPFLVGTAWTAVTEEAISGVRAVQISQSGYIRIAMASVSGRMPALGVVVDNVASGQSCTVYTAGPFQFTSGMINVSGVFGQPVFVGRSGHISRTSGWFNSGGFVSGDQYQQVGYAWFSGSVVLWMADANASGTGGAALGSGSIQSGHVVSGTVGGFWGATRHIQSGTVGNTDFGSGAVIAGTVGSGAVVSGNIGSGQIGLNHLSSGAILSGWVIGSGAIKGVGDAGAGGGIRMIASGTISTDDIASGTFVSIARITAPFGSGLPVGFLTEEAISGTRAVCISESGTIRIAMASLSGRMPAVGVVIDNVASGSKPTIYTAGSFVFTSGMINASGYAGKPLYVGRSGQISTQSGWFNSGGLQSGDIWQPIAFSILSGAVQLAVAAQLPFVPGVLLSGDIGSGQVSTFHFASGSAVPELVAWYMTCELISGVKAVAFVSGEGDRIVRAEQGSGLRMPAIGVVYSGGVSGTLVAVCLRGKVTSSASGMMASGFQTRGMFVGSGGICINNSGHFGTGAFNSGNHVQWLGQSISGGIYVNPHPYTLTLSGLPNLFGAASTDAGGV